MYEQPQMTVVGEVNDVVLGVASLGTDIDTTQMFGDFEFQQDREVADEQ